MQKFQVVIKPGDVPVDVLEGSTIMEAINEAGLDADFPCGGMGKCGKCRVRLIKGSGQPTALEKESLDIKELETGIRLACLTKVQEDIVVELLNHKKLEHNILIASEERKIRIEPHLNKTFTEVDKPSLQDHRSDWKRLKDSLARHGINSGEVDGPISVLRQLPETLRKANHYVTAVMYGSKLTGVEQGDTTGTMFGMAFDIGTTTIVGYLLDLYSGKELAVSSALNPQTKFGADVISRITFSNQEEDGLAKLHNAVIEAINRLIGEAAEKAGISKQHIYAVTIAANTTMHHLFLGITPRNIAVSPYVSGINEALILSPSELEIHINEAGKIFVLPNIAGFVGADTTAVLLAAELDRSDDIKLIIDIGTNGEIALGSKKRIAACSAAAGPAFEGAQISSGMRGAAGAIDHVRFTDRVEYSVIGGGRPQGICGSALLDVAAGFVELGIIDKRGKFLSPDKITDSALEGFKNNIIQHDGAGAFLLADADTTSHGRPIMVTQNDIRELQLAKGAMAAGIRILMETCGIQLEDIREVLLAGAFGNYLNPHSACVIGLIPRELEGKIKMIGNAAGTGSKLALLSAGEFRRADDIATSVEFVELGSYPKFNSIFAENMYFKLNG